MSRCPVPTFVYIVDDDPGIRESLVMLVQCAGFRARAFSSGDAILASVPSLTNGCLLLDVCLPGQDGVQVLQALRQRGVALPIVFMSGDPSAAASVQQALPGEAAVLQKPMSDEALLAAIRAALRGTGDGHGRGGDSDGTAGSDDAGRGGSGDCFRPAYAVSTTQPCGYTSGQSQRYDFMKGRQESRRSGGRGGGAAAAEEGADND